MAWQDQLQKGSFRDAEFFTDSSEGSIGRRAVVHEYPLRDKPYVEDLGRKAREFTLDVYVLGPDYMAARDRLIEAVEKPGPGPLVHHWLGMMQVAVVSCRVYESSDEGGMARFSITFVEAGENRFPDASSAARPLVDSAADAAILAEIEAFAARFSLAGLPQFVADAAQLLVGRSLDALVAYAIRYSRVPASLADWLSSVAGVKSSVATLLAAPQDLAASWVDLARELVGVIVPDSASGADRSRADAAAALRGLAASTTLYPAVSATTATRSRQAENQGALLGLVRRTAIIEESRATRQRTFDSFTEAANVRDDLADRLDIESETVTDHALYEGLVRLRVAVIRDVTARAADLARVSQYTPAATLPALVVAHALYGDASRDSGLIARNRSIRHPGFVPGGRALEVWADA